MEILKKDSFEKKKKSHRRFGPADRNLFVQSSRKQDHTAKRIHVIMRFIMGFVIIAVIIILLTFIFRYLIPFLQAEFGAEQEPESSAVSSEASAYEPVSMVLYDELGLPIYGNDISLKLINAKKPETAAFEPDTEKVNGVLVDSQIATALKMMVNAAKDDGYLLAFEAGYVSYDEQKKLYEEKVSELQQSGEFSFVMARSEAKKYVPVGGESDFQTGLCIKLEGDSETFKSSKTYEWLNMNMSRYGFVFRFPEKKSSYTGLQEDYTVIRYVGGENAKKMRQLSMCLEEYISYLTNQ